MAESGLEISFDPVLPPWSLQALWPIVDCPQDPTFLSLWRIMCFVSVSSSPPTWMSTSEVNTSVEERKENKMPESGGPVPPRQAARLGSVLRAPGKDTHLGKWSVGLRSSSGARDSSPGSSAGESFVQGTLCGWYG